MKKNILIISIRCLLTITISYTYSAFNNTIKGTITATTNNWKFSVNVPSGVKENNYYKVLISSTSGSFDIVLDNTGSMYLADYMIELENVNLPNDFVLNNSLYEGTLNSESKTINVSYSSISSAKGYIKVKVKAVKAEFAVTKNGYSEKTEFWSRKYRKYIKTINFNDDISNMPGECTEDNLCWDISEDENQSKKVYGYLVDSGSKDSSSNTLYNLYIVSSAPIFAPSDCSYIFGFSEVIGPVVTSNLVSIDFNNNFNTSNVGDMSSMFYGCASLASLDLSSFNTSNVYEMIGMFDSCSSLTKLDLSNFDTSNVIDMQGMFYKCSSLTTTIKIMNASVTSYDDMFYDAATSTGSKITVNYIADASSLVDDMIATKSDTSNVIKGNVIS